jgi:hypothetical protein
MINFKDIMFTGSFFVLGLSIEYAITADNTQALYLTLACIVATLGWWCNT